MSEADVTTPEFVVNRAADLDYAVTADCARGSFAMLIHKVGEVSIQSVPVVTGCNTLVRPLQAGTYYIQIRARDSTYSLAVVVTS